jgi:hypothetical protein
MQARHIYYGELTIPSRAACSLIAPINPSTDMITVKAPIAIRSAAAAMNKLDSSGTINVTRFLTYESATSHIPIAVTSRPANYRAHAHTQTDSRSLES